MTWWRAARRRPRVALAACLALACALATDAGAREAPAGAEGSDRVAILVHGYLGGPSTWFSSGVVEPLAWRGWGRRMDAGGRRLYLAALASEAPLAAQVAQLAGLVQAVTRVHPRAEIALVGHSAGGVVARALLVAGGCARCTLLVTIASPHLGTDRADLGLLAGTSPFGLAAPWVGLGTVVRSQALYADLRPAWPGTTLGALNRLAHPRHVHYVSIVRHGAFVSSDSVVPAASQDMNRVPGVTGGATLIRAGVTHALQPLDGLIVAEILEQWSREGR